METGQNQSPPPATNEQMELVGVPPEDWPDGKPPWHCNGDSLPPAIVTAFCDLLESQMKLAAALGASVPEVDEVLRAKFAYQREHGVCPICFIQGMLFLRDQAGMFGIAAVQIAKSQSGGAA